MKGHVMHRIIVVLSLVGALGLSLVAGSTSLIAAQDATPAGGELADGVAVVPPDAQIEGASLGEWEARWWQRMASFPPETHPFLDERGERCGYVQSDPVFFLQGPPQLEAGGAITCVVPAETAIFVPIIGFECSTVEPAPYFGRDEAELRGCATAGIDAVTAVSVSIDGQEVPELERYRATTPLFALTFAEANIFDVPPGIAQSVVDGYQLIIESLPEGEHEIKVYAEIEGGEVHTDLSFRVIVEAPIVIEPAATPGAATPVATPAT
jgi:hypothetical protein